jgi:UPF0716 protein FxsA
MAKRRGWVLWVVLGAIIALPIGEVAVLVASGRAIGALPTIGLMLATSLVGAWLSQREGRRSWKALKTAFEQGRMPAGELADAVLILVGGLFLMLPGFVSDIVGLICLLPITRPLGRKVLTWIVARAAAGRGINLDTLRNQVTIAGDPSTVIRGETVPDAGTTTPRDDVVIRGEVEP